MKYNTAVSSSRRKSRKVRGRFEQKRKRDEAHGGFDADGWCRRRRPRPPLPPPPAIARETPFPITMPPGWSCLVRFRPKLPPWLRRRSQDLSMRGSTKANATVSRAFVFEQFSLPSRSFFECRDGKKEREREKELGPPSAKPHLFCSHLPLLRDSSLFRIRSMDAE